MFPSPRPCFYLGTKHLVLQSLHVSDQAIKSRKSHVCCQRVILRRGTQPDQTVLLLLQPSPGHSSPSISELMNGWLAGSCSFLLQGGEEKKRRKKKKTKNNKKPETWMKHLYSREGSASEIWAKTQMIDCFRDTQPSWAAGSNSPGPACGLQRVPLQGALQIPPSHSFLSLPKHIT